MDFVLETAVPVLEYEEAVGPWGQYLRIIGRRAPSSE